jgi:acetyl-CoA acetyltransferase
MKKTDKATGQESIVDVTVDRDECNRPDTTLEGLQALQPVFCAAAWRSRKANTSPPEMRRSFPTARRPAW